MFPLQTAKLRVPAAKHVSEAPQGKRYLLPSPATRVPQPQLDGATPPSSK